jgi:hypothetical protein
MHKHDWSMLFNAYANSGQTVTAFCAARGLTPSKFYAERAKQGAPQGMVPIVVEASALRITLSLRTSVEISGTAGDIAQVLRCL